MYFSTVLQQSPKNNVKFIIDGMHGSVPNSYQINGISRSASMTLIKNTTWVGTCGSESLRGSMGKVAEWCVTSVNK